MEQINKRITTRQQSLKLLLKISQDNGIKTSAFIFNELNEFITELKLAIHQTYNQQYHEQNIS